jgi:hypothetical protein
MCAGGSAPPPSARPHPPKTQSPTPPQNESPGPGSNIPNAGPPRPPRRPDLQPPEAFFDKRPESIHLELAQMPVVDQDLGEGLSVLGGHPEPSANGFIFVAGISSAALRLPRRITTSRVRATSAGVTRKRSIAVPRVGPNERPQFRQTQRGRPPLLPFFTTWVAPQRGQGGFWELGFRFIGPTSVGIWPRLYHRALLRGVITL